MDAFSMPITALSTRYNAFIQEKMPKPN